MEKEIEKLKNFCVAHEIRSPISAVMAIAPFFGKISKINSNKMNGQIDVEEWKQYGLAKDANWWELIKNTTEEITGQEVDGLCFVSAYPLTSKKEWMTDQFFQGILNNPQDYLRECLKKDLGVTLSPCHTNKLKSTLGMKKWNNIHGVIYDLLINDLLKTYKNILWSDFWENHFKSIFIYLCYCFADSHDMRKNYENLLKILNEYIILGELKDGSKKLLIIKS